MNHPAIQRWLARGPRARKGFGGQRNVRGRTPVDEFHERSGLIPKSRVFLDDPSYAIESKEY